MNDTPLAGKRLLITAGCPSENIDGIRHYANRTRSHGFGAAVAETLKLRGANVTVVSPDGTNIVSGRELMAAVDALILDKKVDAVLCLAAISSLRAASEVAHKIKAKDVAGKKITLDVVGNVDVEKRAQRWGIPVWGYSTGQNPFFCGVIPDWFKGLVAELPLDFDIKPLSFSADPRDEKEPFQARPLKGQKVLITTGPTEEILTVTGDLISNFSSGQQGFDIACAFAERGASVVCVAGPTRAPEPCHENIKIIHVSSARAMLRACEENLPVDFFVGVAAVADFGSREPQRLTLPEGEPYTLILDQNPDILETMGRRTEKRPRCVIGFAAETDPDKILSYAEGKRTKKNADVICANLVGRASPSGSGENQIILVTGKSAPQPLPVLSKRQAAEALISRIILGDIGC